MVTLIKDAGVHLEETESESYVKLLSFLFHWRQNKFHCGISQTAPYSYTLFLLRYTLQESQFQSEFACQMSVILPNGKNKKSYTVPDVGFGCF